MNITRNDVDNDFMQLKGLMKVGNDSTPSYFSTYDNIYLFTNDRLKDIFEPLDVTQGILTVTGSGDQALMAILKGAKNVKMFDINKLAKYFALFKFSAVSCLSYDEFIKLYKINKPFSNYVAGGFLTNVDTDLYEKVCSNLENTVALFFELLFDVMINATACEKFNLINVKHYPKLSGYLTRKNYEKLQENMKKLTSVDFVDCNIFDLNKNLGDEKYSAMVFSNISSYFSKCELEKFLKLLKQLELKLTCGGLIQAGYGVKKRNNNDFNIGKRGLDTRFVDANKSCFFEKQSHGMTITYYKPNKRK